MPRPKKQQSQSMIKTVIATGAPVIALGMILAALIAVLAKSPPPPPPPLPDPLTRLDHESLAEELIGFQGSLTPQTPPTKSRVVSVLDVCYERAIGGDQSLRDAYELLGKENSWNGLTREIRSWDPIKMELTVPETLGAAIYLSGMLRDFEAVEPFLDYGQTMSHRSPESIITEAIALIISGQPDQALNVLERESTELHHAGIAYAFATQYYTALAIGQTGDNEGAELGFRMSLQLVEDDLARIFEQTVARLAYADSLLANVDDNPENLELARVILETHEIASAKLPAPHALIARGELIWARFYSTGHKLPHYNLDQARIRLSRATTQYRQIGSKPGLAMCARYEGRIALGEGDYLAAAQHYRLESELQAPMVVFQAAAMINVAIALSNEALRVNEDDNTQSARNYMTEALDAAEEAVGLLVRDGSADKTLSMARQMADGCRAWLEVQEHAEAGDNDQENRTASSLPKEEVANVPVGEPITD